MDNEKAIRAAKLTLGGILEKRRAKTAVERAQGQIAPSKYLPEVPRQVHANGGYVPTANLPIPKLAVAAPIQTGRQPGVLDVLGSLASLGKSARSITDLVSPEKEEAAPEPHASRVEARAEGLTPEATAAMEALRKGWTGADFGIVSGYRDPEHNERVGGAKNSQHIHGNAFDVNTTGWSPEDKLALADAAWDAGFRGFGFYDNNMHFDVADPRAWGPSYSRDSIPEWARGWAQERYGYAEGGEVTDLGQVREQKQLQTYHTGMMDDIHQRMSNAMQAHEKAVDAGVFDGYEVGDMLHGSAHPMRITGRYMQKWKPTPFAMRSFERMGTQPTIIEHEGEQYIPMLRYETGKEGMEGWQEGSAYLDGIKAAGYQKMGGLRAVKAAGGSVGMGDDEVPQAPGQSPIPEDHVRLYHQTSVENIPSIMQGGLMFAHAKGYEGPKAIYADEKGFYGKPGQVPTIEFSVHKDRWRYPPFVQGDVDPKSIIAAHLPWHGTARYIEEDDRLLKDVLSGEHDHLLDDQGSNEARAINYIKKKYAAAKAEGGAVIVPEKTVKAYKLFRTKGDGKLYPLFVNADKPVPMGEWLEAEEGPQGKAQGKVKSKLGDLAYRPGWHAGDLPMATHIGGKSDPSLKKPDYRPDNHVWAEVEMAADKDWQSVANSRGKGAKAHITDQVPYGGFYRYKTNPNMTGNWLIGGHMKVNRVLPDEEVKAINDAAGTADLPRRSEGFAAGGTAMFEGIHEDLQDERGNPLELWHGTPGEGFSEFKDEKLGSTRDYGFYGRGHYLTPDQENASEYAGSHADEGTLMGPLHAALKNPYIWDASEQGAHRTLRDLQSMGIMKGQDRLEAWDNLQRHHIDPFMREMQKRGHDGVIVRTNDYHEGKPYRVSEIVVFKPSAIKHKDAERFDPNDPNIYHARGGVAK